MEVERIEIFNLYQILFSLAFRKQNVFFVLGVILAHTRAIKEVIHCFLLGKHTLNDQVLLNDLGFW